MNKEERLIHMKLAEDVAEEMFHSLTKRLNKEKMVVADSLHVGVVLSSFIINAASKHCNIPKEEVLNQFLEALEEDVLEGSFEEVQLN